jgi:hypothetical protein
MKNEYHKESVPLGVSIVRAFIIAIGVVGALLLVFGLILSTFDSTIGIWVAVLGLTIVIFSIILYVAVTNGIDDISDLRIHIP